MVMELINPSDTSTFRAIRATTLNYVIY